MFAIATMIFALGLSAQGQVDPATTPAAVPAQDQPEKSVTAIARMGMENAATYRYAEVYTTFGRWIGPDVFWIDYGHSNFGEVAGGGGYIFEERKHFLLIGEVYADQAVGSAARSETSIVPWLLVAGSLPKHEEWVGEIVYFPYLPVTKGAHIQQVLEHAKLEREFRRFKIGGGYGAYQFANGPWSNRPFVTVTLKTKKLGNLEFWVQRMPQNDVQLQIRYAGNWSFRRQR
jgi:hypothetical protein